MLFTAVVNACFLEVGKSRFAMSRSLLDEEVGLCCLKGWSGTLDIAPRTPGRRIRVAEAVLASQWTHVSCQGGVGGGGEEDVPVSD